MAARRKNSDESLKAAVLEYTLEHAAFDGFSDALLARAGKEVGADAAALKRLFPARAQSLVEAFSERSDDAMDAALAKRGLSKMKIRARIREAVLARLDAARPHKEAARRAAAFLTLPPNAALGAKLLYRTVDRMWRSAGDTSTDFNFYTKRAILAGVYTSTTMRWFTDDSADEAVTRAFLDARIENVMQFETLKAKVKERASVLPSLADVLGAFNRSSTR